MRRTASQHQQVGSFYCYHSSAHFFNDCCRGRRERSASPKKRESNFDKGPAGTIMPPGAPASVLMAALLSQVNQCPLSCFIHAILVTILSGHKSSEAVRSAPCTVCQSSTCLCRESPPRNRASAQSTSRILQHSTSQRGFGSGRGRPHK